MKMDNEVDRPFNDRIIRRSYVSQAINPESNPTIDRAPQLSPNQDGHFPNGELFTDDAASGGTIVFA
jgi:hypothetical protein